MGNVMFTAKDCFLPLGEWVVYYWLSNGVNKFSINFKFPV